MKKLIKFTKMEAYGNDYIYVYDINDDINLHSLAKKITDRHFGVGADGLVLINDSKVANFKMRIFNPDGTEAQMCGNALRSVGKYVYEHNLTKKKNITIETLGGIKNIELELEDEKISSIKTEIGKPIFDPTKIPVNTKKERFFMEDCVILDKTFKISSISLGNPHTIVFVNDVLNFDVLKYGKAIENNKELFPDRTNITFAEIINRERIRIREWERGTGETLGCATGSASAVVIAYNLGLVNNKIEVEQLGGSLQVNYQDNIEIIGNSNNVFDGQYYWEDYNET